jgi:hypothetical protein
VPTIFWHTRPLALHVPEASKGMLLMKPAQQGSPSPPQPQELALLSPQIAPPPGHAPPAATHAPAAQQPPPVQVLSSQHGCPGAPHATNPPSMHTLDASEPVAPDGTHWASAESRHAPSVQPNPGQGGPNDSPHAPDRFGPMQQLVFDWFGKQPPPGPTHVPVPVSQQPAVHVRSAQQG